MTPQQQADEALRIDQTARARQARIAEHYQRKIINGDFRHWKPMGEE